MQNGALTILYNMCETASRLDSPVSALHDTVVGTGGDGGDDGGGVGAENEEARSGRDTIMLVARAGAIPSLVRLMQNSGNPDAQHHASVTLVFMAGYRDCAAIIAGCPGAISTLADRTGAGYSSRSRAAATACLAYLAAFAGLQAAGVDYDDAEAAAAAESEAAAEVWPFRRCIPQLVDCLKVDKDLWLRRNAVDILTNLTTRGGVEMCWCVYEAGAVIHLVRMLNEPPPGPPEDVRIQLLWCQTQALLVLSHQKPRVPTKACPRLAPSQSSSRC